MHIVASACFVLLILFPYSLALRAQKANRKSLQLIKALINNEASKQLSAMQSDQIDLFSNLVRNPNSTRNKDELTVNNPEDYFQGDVDLSEKQVKALERQFQEGGREKRKVGRTPLYHLWDRTRAISFDFADSIPRQTRAKIRDAMRLWQRHTCVRFEEGGPDVDRLEFFDGGGCSSFVGRVGGTQGISIATPGCDVVGIISHEIGHSLGVFHEQARPDQDRFINVNYNNIPLSRWNNFQALGRRQSDTFGLPYDTGSVMHYGPYGFATDPYVPTIRTLERSLQSTIGQRIGPSFLDYQAINMAYGCTDHCKPLNCLRNGYVNPNNCSQCQCPDGLTGQFCGEILPSTASCGGLITAYKEMQYISSPNYPDHFERNSECYWMIQAPPGGRVLFEFVDEFEFRCEDTCDKSYVEVKYHNDKRLTGSRHCCSTIPTHRFISFNNEMIVILRGFGGTSTGFRARFWTDKDDESKETTFHTSTLASTTKETTISSTMQTIGWTRTTRHTTIRHTRPTTAFRKTTRTTRPKASWTQKPPTAPPVFSILPPTTTLPTIPVIGLTTQSPDIISSGAECGCGEWSEWVGDCSQECGGCGHRLRTRECEKDSCRKEEKRPCNFKVCPDGTNFLINNGEFHILWRGCCVGLFRSGNECSALQTEQNPFLKIITSLLSIHDEKNNRTEKVSHAPFGAKLIAGKHIYSNLSMCLTWNFFRRLLVFLLIICCSKVYSRTLPSQRNLVVTVKTTQKYSDSRLSSILNTWYNYSPKNIYFITDIPRNGLEERSNENIIRTACGAGHTRKALSCKMATELKVMLDKNARWSCHFDDDNYVNIPLLQKFLSRLNPNDDWYLGKPSIAEPFQIIENNRVNSFWFATGGAGICISRSVLAKIRPMLDNNGFERTSTKFGLPDDVTLGYIMQLFGIPLTQVAQFHSHLEDLSKIPKDSLREQFSLSGSPENNVRLSNYKQNYFSQLHQILKL